MLHNYAWVLARMGVATFASRHIGIQDNRYNSLSHGIFSPQIQVQYNHQTILMGWIDYSSNTILQNWRLCLCWWYCKFSSISEPLLHCNL